MASVLPPAEVGSKRGDRAQARAERACPQLALDSVEAADRIVLVALEPTLECAIAASLAPWGFELLRVQVELGASMPSTSAGARFVAEKYDARAAVWVAQDAEGHALWLYDWAQDRTVARPVPAPPFSPILAAALASSVKTSVRMVGVYVEPPSDVSESSDVSELDAVKGKVAEPAARGAEPPVQLMLRGGVRLGPFAQGHPRLRYQAGLRTALLGRGSALPNLWGALSLAAGELHDVRTEGFVGHASDPALRLELGHTFAWGEAGYVELTQALGLNLVRVWGVSLVSGSRRSETRLDAVFSTGAEAGMWLGPMRWGVALSGGYWTRRLQYVLADTAVLQTQRWSTQIELAVSVALD